MKIKTAAEIPFAYLQKHADLYDYEFCLAHMMDQTEYSEHFNQQYEQFYLSQNAKGRMTILDNGVFELHHPVSIECLLRVYSKFPKKENVYIVSPDVMNDAKATLTNVTEFLKQMPPSIKIMAVAQGQTLEDWISCYRLLTSEPRVKIIGTTYDIAFFPSLSANVKLSFSKTRMQMWGRLRLFEYLRSKGILQTNIWHHLLGCSDPVELNVQKGIPCIMSVDTSFPYAQAYAGKVISTKGLPILQDKEPRTSDYFTRPYDVKIDQSARANIAQINTWTIL
jgi:hypothetical protein